jgi:hypothetical protein
MVNKEFRTAEVKTKLRNWIFPVGVFAYLDILRFVKKPPELMTLICVVRGSPPGVEALMD